MYEEQKRFIGNASHELQTPLAVCSNRLELLVDNTQLDDYQLSEIEKTLETLNYISRLNKSLLPLTKIENQQFKEEVEVDLGQIARQSLENLGEIYESLNVKVTISEDKPLVVSMDSTLASSLVNNLMKNAYVHNHAGGTIVVSITENRLSIGNSGSSAPLNPIAVFDTFYKKGENANSSGLGLAITKAICNRYDFSISYQFIDNHHIFILKTK